MSQTYKMVMLGGVARMSRPSNVVYPLPSVRCDRKVCTFVHVRDVERTVVKRTDLPKVLPMVRYSITFP